MKLITFLLFSVACVFANGNIKSLDIYLNKSFINQNLNLSKKSEKLLGEVRLEDLKFTLDESCKINSFNIETKNYENDQLSEDIEKLSQKINFEENQIKALKSEISFLEKNNLSNIEKVSILQKSSAFVKKQILEDYNEIYNLSNQIKKDKQALDKLTQKRTNTKYTKLDYDISCKKPAFITYPIYNLQKKSLYEVSYDSKKEEIELKNLLYITQSSGEDLKNIAINLYTYNYINQIKPNPFIPEYLDFAEKHDAVTEAANGIKPMLMKATRVLKTPAYDYYEDTTKSFFKASNITLLSGKENKVLFAKDSYKASKSLEIDGYSMSQAFYKVDFKSKKLYGITNANLYLDGTYIGKTTLKELQKNKKSSIYFGANRFIDIKKELVKDMKEEPFFSINKTKTQKIWNYEIKNSSKQTQKIVLLERVPVSKHEDIKVKLIGESKENKMEKNGKIYFEFDLNPNESKTVNFGYEIEKPTKK